MQKTLFDQFTRKYALSKTLRFELKLVGKTLENMCESSEYKNDNTLQTFMKGGRSNEN